MENIQEQLQERLQIFFSSAFLFLLLLLVVWRNGYFSFSRSELKPNLDLKEKHAIGGKSVLLAFGIFILLQLLVIPFSYELWLYFSSRGEVLGSSPELQGWVTVYGIGVTGLGLLLFYLSLSEKVKSIVWGPYGFSGWKSKFQDFSIALITWLLSYPLVVAVGQIIAVILILTYQNVEPEQVAVKQIRTATTSTPLLIAMVVSVIFFVPLMEELLFRGFLQSWLKRFMSSAGAVALTSFIFAIFHFAPSQGMGNFELLISLFVLSCFLGFIYERQKSLWAPISMHAIFNAFSLLLIIYGEK